MSKNDDLVRRLEALPRRKEKISGQSFSYVKLDDVLAVVADTIERGAAQGVTDDITQAARDVVSSRMDTYKARNGKEMGIQDENGEKCWIVPFDEMFALEAALSTPPAPAPDAGEKWKLVPVKPTEEMIDAAVQAHEPLEDDDYLYRAEFRLTYRAMIDAASVEGSKLGVVEAALQSVAEISERIKKGGYYRASLSDIEDLSNHVRRLAAPSPTPQIEAEVATSEGEADV